MAKNNRTTSKRRRATAAKATKRRTVRNRAVQWGIDDKGRQLIMWAPSWAVHDIPAGRWRMIRDNVEDLRDVANGINALRAHPTGDVADAMAVIAARGVDLINDLIENTRTFAALSPKLREAVAKADARMAARTEGGAQ
jgi:hypothetical protein